MIGWYAKADLNPRGSSLAQLEQSGMSFNGAKALAAIRPGSFDMGTAGTFRVVLQPTREVVGWRNGKGLQTLELYES